MRLSNSARWLKQAEEATAGHLGLAWLFAWDDVLNVECLPLGVLSQQQTRQAYSELIRLYDARQGIIR